MSVSATLVKELREKTGVGMMACKKALEESSGDLAAAEKALREKGLSAATKKSERSTNEGKVFIETSADRKEAVILEINCETDFVSSNDAFQAFGQSIVKALLEQNTIQSEGELDALTVDGTGIKEYTSDAILKLGENISLGSFKRFKGSGQISSYSHMGGKIGVVVEFDNAVPDDLGKDVAMHVAAASPEYVSKEEVPAERVEEEKGILSIQLKNEGKPEAIIEKIVLGKISKFYKGICLLEQEFVKDPEKTVKQILPQGVGISQFARLSK